MQHHQVILAGAGHAHLHVASHAEMFAERGVELVLVDPGRFWYSGLATGMLGGYCEPDDDTLDPGELVRAHQGRFIRACVVGLDRAARCVRLSDGATLDYDLLSFDIGSEVQSPAGLADQPDIIPVKPIANLWSLREALRARWRSGSVQTKLCVIGGGATGCEVAANLHALACREHAALELTLITSAPRLLPQWPAGAARGLARALARRGIRLVFNSRVEHASAHALIAGDGTRYLYDFAVVATGLKPPALLAQWDLAVGSDSGLRVNTDLRTADDERIFGAGDCIHFEARELPRLGVFGVREAPVLLANLLAALDAKPLRAYKPQYRYLSILDLGDDTGLALRGRLHWRGRASLWLKHRLDRRFLEQYRSDRTS